MRPNAKYATIVALAAFSVTRAETPTASADVVDKARADLRSLSVTINRDSALPQKSAAFALPQLPSFNESIKPAPSKEETSGASRDPAAASPSQGWLFDALKKTDADARVRRDEARDLAARPGGKSSLQVINPLETFLDQWLSPQDKVLLQDRSKPEGMRENLADDRKSEAKDSQLGLSLTPAAGQSVQMSNPYLDGSTYSGMDAAPPSRNPFDASSAQVHRDNPIQLPGLATHESGVRTTLKPVTSAPEPAMPLPTTSLIDERKYFPQLGRF